MQIHSKSFWADYFDNMYTHAHNFRKYVESELRDGRSATYTGFYAWKYEYFAFED